MIDARGMVGAAVVALLLNAGLAQADTVAAADLGGTAEAGRQIYREGVLPSGKTITGTVRGDVELSGELVICGTCHRRSGMGSSEGSQVIPAVAGDILFNPLRLPTSSNPPAPAQRPAYTEETLKRAIRTGVDANGETLDPLMPRYELSDIELAALIAYLKTLSAEISPGVDDREIHFATIVAGPVAPERRKALIDVLQVYAEQKNTETRHESFRAENAPWHKKWLFEPYRKWVIHVWELEGPGSSWPEQLAALYRRQPVFAVLSGVAEGSWAPIHGYCESQRLPCLFPTTDIPVVREQDFYSVYMSKGMLLEGELIARHLRDDGLANRATIQAYRNGDLRAETAAQALADSPSAKVGTTLWDSTVSRPSAAFWQHLLEEARNSTLVLWMNSSDLHELWTVLQPGLGPNRIYLSTTLFGTDPASVPAAARERVYLVHTSELPSRTSRLLLRSTGWLRVKKIHAPEASQIQANAYFALKVAGDALTHMRGYFFRDFMIERIEHTVDNVPYTSVYQRISLAPGQRFAAKGGYIARVSATGKPALIAITDWLTP